MVSPAECCLVVIQSRFLTETLVQNTYRSFEFHYLGQESSVCPTCFFDHS